MNFMLYFIIYFLTLILATNGTKEDWKEKIQLKVVSLYEKKDPEGIARVLWYLDNEDKAYKDSTETAPVWRTLKTALQSSDEFFEIYVARVVEDTKKAENDVSFRETMNRIYEGMMDQSESLVPLELQQRLDLMLVSDASITSGAMGFARAISMIPAHSRAKILALIPKFVANSRMVMAADGVVSAVNKFGGDIVVVGLAGLYLTYDVYDNLWRYWNGEISGRRCTKNIMDSLVTIGAGYYGGIGGAAIGSLGGPLGTIAGAMIGGYFSSQAVNWLIDRATLTLFGLPKEEALENAYNYLGVKMNASNSEINTAFRRLCLKYHPDKGGKQEEFFLLQLNMGVIKMEREKLSEHLEKSEL